MDFKVLATVFVTVFLAELGDKTQLATFLYAADVKNPRLAVFLGAALALVATSAIGVLLGAAISRAVSEKVLGYVAGAGFILVGIWTLYKA